MCLQVYWPFRTRLCYSCLTRQTVSDWELMSHYGLDFELFINLPRWEGYEEEEEEEEDGKKENEKEDDVSEKDYVIPYSEFWQRREQPAIGRTVSTSALQRADVCEGSLTRADELSAVHGPFQ